MTQTIEKTGKGWKALMALSTLVVAVASVPMFIGLGLDDQQLAVKAAPWVVGGVGGHLFARIGAWWYHG